MPAITERLAGGLATAAKNGCFTTMDDFSTRTEHLVRAIHQQSATLHRVDRHLPDWPQLGEARLLAAKAAIPKSDRGVGTIAEWLVLRGSTAAEKRLLQWLLALDGEVSAHIEGAVGCHLNGVESLFFLPKKHCAFRSRLYSA